MSLVRHRGLATIFPKLVVHKGQESGVHAIPLDDPTVHRTHYIVERRDRFKKKETAMLEAFLKFELMAIEQLSGEPSQ